MKTEKKSGVDRAQPAVRDEWWSDERVLSFLDMKTAKGESRDYHILIKAYRGMVPEAFERFIAFFIEAGLNLDDPGPDGRTILELIQTHKKAADYIRIIQAAKAG